MRVLSAIAGWGTRVLGGEARAAIASVRRTVLGFVYAPMIVSTSLLVRGSISEDTWMWVVLSVVASDGAARAIQPLVRMMSGGDDDGEEDD